jgi:hypothetical protein
MGVGVVEMSNEANPNRRVFWRDMRLKKEIAHSMARLISVINGEQTSNHSPSSCLELDIVENQGSAP